MAVLPTLYNLRALLQRVIFVPIVYGFISLLPMFLTGWENSDRLADRLFSTIRSKENMFDFIVVGGGTAGALVANRLAEHYRVLLLEAGGTPMPFQSIPALALKFLNHPQTDWSHKTVPQRKACLNSINQQSSWSAGRSLGGTTNINFMTHLRGHPKDYESWAESTGDPSWSYSGVLPYFKRYETFSGTSNDPEARGHDGELRIRKPSYIGLSEDWVRAGQELGYPFVDLNGNHEEGFGILQYPVFKGLRQSTYAAFLLPMHKSPRLTIRRYALVRKVLFRDMNNMAYGVEYIRHGKIETAIATKEVILSAGTMGSSKLLMLSGVGPRAQLEELGIPVRSDLRVGRNLQDHLAVHLGPFFIKEPKSFLFDRDVTPENIVRWLFLGTGPITTTGYQGAASIASSFAKSRGEGNWPDLHLILHGQAIHQGYSDAFAYAYGLQEDELMQYYNNAIGRDSFHIYVVGARPTSTGRILLSGASINDPLIIDPGYLKDGGNADFKVLIEGVKTAFHIANTSMFLRLGTEFTQAKLPGCHELEFGSDAYWECYIRRFTLTMHNPVGTVALGDVLHNDLKVKGTRGLRVIDASIQPTLVSTGTAASTLMIAEKGVDLILKDHGIPDRDQDLFDVIFGKNGFFKRNPILKILQREFDTLNPVRALFKPFTVSRSAENDAKERFTRNGRFDNPFLQVISTVFGNAKNFHADSSVDGTSNIDMNLEHEKKLNESMFLKRSNENFVSDTNEDKTNVISKNQWVLQLGTKNGTVEQTYPSLSISIPVAKSINVASDLNVTKISLHGKKKKGGKRYALLQAILREQELNATLAKLPKKVYTTVTTPIPSPSSPPTLIQIPTKKTVNPVVEVVKFEKVVNALENEIAVDSKLEKTQNYSKGSVVPFVAKPIAENPSAFGNGLFSVSGPASANTDQQTSNPFSQLLNTFGAFMNALTKKDRPSSSSAATNGNFFTFPQSQNPLQKNNNGNIFSFLSPSNNTGNSKNSPKSNSNELFATGPSQNPFSFLFKSILSPTPAPTSVENIVKNDVANAVGTPTDFKSNTTRNDRSNNDFFSSWFKPVSNSLSTNSWFKPLDKPFSQQSTTSWFKPFNFNDKSSSSLFKPLSFTDKDKHSWFKPLNLNTQPASSNSFAPESTTSQPLVNPIGNLFDLFFGGLKKHERRAVFSTLDTMLQAGESLADILGTGKDASTTKNNQKQVNFFEQIAKGKRNIEENESQTQKSISVDNDSLLKSLIALNNVINSYSSTTTTEKPVMSDNSLEEFISTFNYPTTERETNPTIRIPITTSKSETTTPRQPT